jgi:SAM-dependent methyltransferase
MNRKQRRASAHRGKTTGPGAVTSPSREAMLAEMFRAAAAHHRAGAIADAERGYRHILTLFPNHAETHGMLGVALFAQGKISEAVLHFERVAALKPDVPGVYDDLGKAYLAAGQPELAMQAAGRALELGETERRKTFFAYCAKSVVFTADSPRLRQILLRALLEGWARPRDLTRVCVSLIMTTRFLKGAIAGAQRAWPRRLSETEMLDTRGVAALFSDELLLGLLETDPIDDIGIERVLTNVRYAMLRRALSGDRDVDPQHLRFYTALARQCFINEYVYALSEAEATAADKLRSLLAAALENGAPIPELWLTAVGAYFPLHAVANAEILLAPSWPPCVRALLVQQVEEPAQERRIATTIPALTTIDDEVSRAVRQQYEENPYPRWITAGPTGQPSILNDRQPDQTRDVLIAGCGTGLSTVEFARHARSMRILAIDLSLASLSYAKRMAQSFGLTNVEFAQADILQLGSIGRQFDFIDASGVLHHLADPWAGWRVLLSLLRPGGAMEVGLYSERARRNVVAARAMIAQRGYRPALDDIRRCREEIAAAEDGSLLKSLMRSEDFFTVSACRDLLFHAQEHRLTLPDIKAFLAANNLQFAGFVLPPPVLQRFALRFPDRAAPTDLDCWDAFEADAPETFGGMYLFSLRKPAASPDKRAAAD